MANTDNMDNTATFETVVIGTFDRTGNAQRAADELRSAGFSDADMMLAGRESAPATRGAAPMSDTRAGAANAPVMGTGAGELQGLLDGWNVPPEVANRVALNAGEAHAMLVLRPGARQQDAIRVLKDFGARIYGHVSDADWDAANLQHDFSTYDTSVGTRATFPGAADVPTDQLGALTGREVTWDEAHPRYRSEWQQRTGGTDAQWQAAEPGYRYAYEMRQQPGYAGQDWAAAEPGLRGSYDSWARQRGYHQHAAGDDEGVWDKVKDVVRDAWDRITFEKGPVSEAQPVQPVDATDAARQDRVVERQHWVRMDPWGGGMTGTTGVTVDNPDTERPDVVHREMP